MRSVILLIFVGLAFVLCHSAYAWALSLTSDAFVDGEKLPVQTGYQNGNISPLLKWEDAPENTMSYAMIMDDPDAREWTHWVIYNIPVSLNALKEGFPKDEELPDGTRQGRNDFGKIGYGGPCPPSGIHRYVFRLFALDTALDLDPGSSKPSLLKAMNGHILAEAKLMGKFSH